MTGLDLANARRALGYTQAELARAIGKTSRTVQRWEASADLPDSIGWILVGLMKAREKAK